MFSKSAKSGIRVIIYGTHSDDWMAALGAEGPVWRSIPEVREVLVAPLNVGSAILIPPSRLKTVLIPLMEEHIRLAPKEYLKLIPSPNALEILRNKARFADYLEESGFSALSPKRYGKIEDVIFPCMLKRVDLNAGCGIARVNSIEELTALKAEKTWKGSPVLLQEYIDSPTEYSTHSVFHNGELLFHRTYSFPNPTGSVRHTTQNITSTTTAEIVLKAIKSLLAPLKYSGPCNVDYKFRPDGSVAIFEINPRLGGSMMRPESLQDLIGAMRCLIENALRTRKSIFQKFYPAFARAS